MRGVVLAEYRAMALGGVVSDISWRDGGDSVKGFGRFSFIGIFDRTISRSDRQAVDS
jgi:hypothetical protein